MLRQFLLSEMDETVKVWLGISAGATAVFLIDPGLQTVVLLVCLVLCLLGGAGKFVLWFCLLMAGLGLLGLGVLRLVPAWSSWIWSFAQFIIKFSPMLAMAFFLGSSLNTSRLLRSLESLKAPKSLVIPLGVCLRFIPSVAAECRQVFYGMRMRGIGINPQNLLRRPFECLGYVMAPLLVRSLTVGDELARAAVARAIEKPGVKASYLRVGFRPLDGVITAVWTLGLVGLIVWDLKIYGQGLGGA